MLALMLPTGSIGAGTGAYGYRSNRRRYAAVNDAYGSIGSVPVFATLATGSSTGAISNATVGSGSSTGSTTESTEYTEAATITYAFVPATYALGSATTG
uniref:Uncharacterized protein n=1 Tax=Picea glauca TaxID=3330 RepID=A0A101LX73_PICGL|nr:hypothetical protein ABT39_MTgene6026 [Picea glauca]QHR86822.1 hypothetical protein Q903MT_gene829 [Picea sitchensis]